MSGLGNETKVSFSLLFLAGGLEALNIICRIFKRRAMRLETKITVTITVRGHLYMMFTSDWGRGVMEKGT